MKNIVVVAGNKMWVTFCPKKAKKLLIFYYLIQKIKYLYLNKKLH
jgi:hypothetical protein